MLPEFHWVIPNLLAGSGRPGLLSPIADDVEQLVRARIACVVSLTEEPPHLPLQGTGIRAIHFPIADMGIPFPRRVEELLRSLSDHLSRKEAVLFHCKVGQGRTGTILACCLVSLGRSAREAVAEVRRAFTGYIQTEAQELFVTHYAEHLATIDSPVLTVGAGSAS